MGMKTDKVLHSAPKQNRTEGRAEAYTWQAYTPAARHEDKKKWLHDTLHYT